MISLRFQQARQQNLSSPVKPLRSLRLTDYRILTSPSISMLKERDDCDEAAATRLNDGGSEAQRRRWRCSTAATEKRRN
ncbi:unnamed protein product [Linum tenue]|uniref:Uncharacterized protein n=1 Tax=Linum tenue TaxID=586396 RepID=A0AAV0MQT7_9ROSI|nr:unnamed protein product [Linum tenue]